MAILRTRGIADGGPTLTTTYDTMGRVSTVNDGSLVRQPATYGPAGELLTMSNGVAETRTYNSMLQLTHLISSGVDITYAYSATQNNGKIVSQTDNISGEQVQYTYDSLNRLATAQATSNAWGQSYTYDGFGNLTDQNVIAGSAPAWHTSYDPSTNHAPCTDANGNSNIGGLGCSATPYLYDIENRLTGQSTMFSSGGYQYGYAPGNKRVWKAVCCDSSSNPIEEITFWSVTGQKLATYQLVSTPGQMVPTTIPPVLTANQTGTNYYFGSKLIKNASGYVGADRLGSIGKYYPYGQERPSATTNGTEKFTGYFRDAETGLDYADQRYHNPGTGRFLTADPYKNSAGPTDPGSWNRYTYTGGDPANRNDPNGLDWCDGWELDWWGCFVQSSDDPLGIEAAIAEGAAQLAINFAEQSTFGSELGQLTGSVFSASNFIWPTSGLPQDDQFQITLSPIQFLDLAANGFVAANPAILDEVRAGGQVVITVGTGIIAAIYAWFQKNSQVNWTTGSFPTVDEIIAKCQPVGPPIIVPSTRAGNRSGGKSIEQEYKCPDGSTWTIHTVVDGNGDIVLDPHPRPGGPKYSFGGRRFGPQ